MPRFYLFNLLFSLLLVGLNGSIYAQTKTPHVVFVTGDHEYSSERTMPIFAEALEKHFGMRTTVLYAVNEKGERDENYEKNIAGLDALKKADVAIFYLRWRQLPAGQVAKIEEYLKSGRPVIGFRTSTHAFNYPKGHELERWNAFGEVALGSPPGWGGAAGHTHYGHKSRTDVFVNPGESEHPILKGVDQEFQVRSWLYRVKPNYPPSNATELLIGQAVNPDKPAIPNPVAWTWTNQWKGKVFTTTLGHPEDFQEESFQRLLVNALHWSVNKPVPEKWPGKFPINVSYEKTK
ncbi:MAG: ThuA domain-containing protein [Verrucomicrobia bacterium]|nr:ThuA domain-containing protein [Verrucomicrobiota bacterium]